MIQITLTKNDGNIGYTVYFIYEDEEMSHMSFDTHDEAVAELKKLAEMVG